MEIYFSFLYFFPLLLEKNSSRFSSAAAKSIFDFVLDHKGQTTCKKNEKKESEIFQLNGSINILIILKMRTMKILLIEMKKISTAPYQPQHHLPLPVNTLKPQFVGNFLAIKKSKKNCKRKISGKKYISPPPFFILFLSVGLGYICALWEKGDYFHRAECVCTCVCTRQTTGCLVANQHENCSHYYY